MAGSKCRICVLTALAITAGCGNDDEVLVWTPWDRVDGPFQPEVSQPAGPAEPRDRLRIVTYNTRSGFVPEELARAVLAVPELASADVFLFQEVEQMSRQGPSDAAGLAAILGMGHVYATTTKLDPFGTRGMAILSRFTMRDIEVLAPVEPANPYDAIHAEVALAAVIDTTRGPLRVVDMHLSASQNIGERILQARPAVLDAPAPIVVGGDFNTNDYVWDTLPLLSLDAVADTSQFHAFDEYMREIGYDTPTAGLGPTWRNYLEQQRLDAIYTRGVTVEDAALVQSIYESDHLPLRVDIAMP